MGSKKLSCRVNDFNEIDERMINSCDSFIINKGFLPISKDLRISRKDRSDHLFNSYVGDIGDIYILKSPKKENYVITRKDTDIKIKKLSPKERYKFQYNIKNIPNLEFGGVRYGLSNSKSDAISSLPLREGEMYQTEQIEVPFSQQLSDACKLSKKLRNQAVFTGRQIYFLIRKDNYPLARLYPNFARKLYNFMETYLEFAEQEELYRKLFKDSTLQISDTLRKALQKLWGYRALYDFLKFDKVYTDFSGVFAQSAQQTLRNVADSWTGYFRAVKKWRQNPSMFPSEKRPKIPYYGRKFKEFPILFPTNRLRPKEFSIITKELRKRR